MKYFPLLLLLIAIAVQAQVDTRVNSTAAATAADDKTSAADQGANASDRRPALSGLEVRDDRVQHDQLAISGQISGLADNGSPGASQRTHFGATSQAGGQITMQHSWREASLLAE